MAQEKSENVGVMQMKLFFYEREADAQNADSISLL